MNKILPGTALLKTVEESSYMNNNASLSAGINYVVDVSKPDGNKIHMTAFSDDSPFEEYKNYRMALNSYRGSGGGGRLEHTCSLETDELSSRLLKSTDKDLPYSMIKWFEEKEDLLIETDSNWYIIPREWMALSKTREYKKLFKDNSNDE